MNYLIDPLKNSKGYSNLLDSLKSGNTPIYIHGLIRESISHMIYSLFNHMEKNMVLIVEDDIHARKIRDELEAFQHDIVDYFPNIEINFYDIEVIENSLEKARIKVMDRLINKERFILVTTPSAIQRKISTKKYFKELEVSISTDKTINLDEFNSSMEKLKYDRVATIESKGQFAIRGGIVDVFPVQMDEPIRLELFDDEIDSMRTFNIEDQRSTGTIDSFRITPCRELNFDDKTVKKVVKALGKDLEKAVNRPVYGVDSDKLCEKFLKIQQFLEDDLHISNMDLLAAYLKKGDYNTILDYLPEDSIIFVEDMGRVYDVNSERNKRFLTDFTYQMEKGEVFESHENIVVPISEIINKIKEFSAINSTPLLKRTRLLNPVVEINIESLEAASYNRNFTKLVENIREYAYNGYKVVISTGSADNSNSLSVLFQQDNVPVTIISGLEGEIKSGQVYLSDCNMASGFEYRDIKYLFITHKEIYGKERKRGGKRQKKRTSKDIINYSDLSIDDLVVHENHGVGQYKGIEEIVVQGIKKDYIVIQYRGNDRLMIPTDQMDLVQKYIGGESNHPRLNKLSGQEWHKAKQKVKKAVDEMAQDLIDLYAKRIKLKGYQFGEDTQWQKEFEDSFIYEETYSQIRSIEEIKQDMESPRPMDRLLCGDVGYGKTEVAIRAAFKAIMEGKQVAFLVPTTILAQQHYNTVLERFRNYPIKVEMISRFRTPKEQKEIFKDTTKGFVDIIVGTHRILSKDLVFKDLGLLIIDEEQRFGVRHKEKLKALKENVDVLTLSATPIPRTLQMGLVGIRDMSLLEDPPQERSPITTYVLEYNDQVVRDAIQREINRGGQVYFVYNRIDDIDRIQLMIEDMVPDAKIAVAHGRMSERELEDVMIQFTAGEMDVLLCTTIIETGLDIQNVNTMIVYNAERMGLSQLYQLKGRIGRGDRSSFAYFTYEKNKSLTEIAEKRLMAIKDFTEFGSGFKIAMRDLELRGAGNILGESQHGHIAAIGYDLYVKLLEDAIKEVKGEFDQIKSQDVVVEIKIDGYIPGTYIDDQCEKIDMYKKIASIGDEEEYGDIVEELIDRYGDIPKPVQNIMDVSLIKKLAGRCGIGKIKESKGKLMFELGENTNLGMKEIGYLSGHYQGELSFSLVEKPAMVLDFAKKDIKSGIDFLKIYQNMAKELENPQ